MNAYGELHIYTGPMFASKTTSLLLLCEQRAAEDGLNVLLIKPNNDTRKQGIETHDGLNAEEGDYYDVCSKPIDWSITQQEIAKLIENEIEVVGIDEVQFFVNGFNIVSKLLEAGITVYCAGLDMDSFGEPFGCLPQLCAIADSVHKLKANCNICGEDANRTFRKLQLKTDTVLVGGSEIYEARCTEHWLQGMKEWKEWVK